MSAELKIDKGIEMPSFGQPLVEALKKMSKGDSVFIPGMSLNYAHSVARGVFGKGGEISARTMDGGLRIWKL